MKLNKKYLLASGCSYTEGHKLGNESAWPKFLGEELGLEVINLAKGGSGNEWIVQDTISYSTLNLDIAKGEFVTMLGPSGSGKTTTLMMLAGFETPTNGEIYLDGMPISKIHPYEREIGMVFQNYALFPHMTVQENLAFPVEVRKICKSETQEKVQKALDMVELGNFGTRFPAQLSGLYTGDEMDQAVIQWFRNEHKLEVGQTTAESIKKSVGSAMRIKSEMIAVKGRDLVSGIPKTIEVSSDEIRQALKDPINAIVEAVKRALERTPPELSADILDQGIIMTGGGSMLRGIDQLIRERTNVPVNIAEDPLLSVVKGTGKVLENVKKYESVLI